MSFNQLSLDRLGRFGIRALRIVASTVAIVALVRGDWNRGISGSLAWLVFVQVERNLPPAAEGSPPEAESVRTEVGSDVESN